MTVKWASVNQRRKARAQNRRWVHLCRETAPITLVPFLVFSPGNFYVLFCLVLRLFCFLYSPPEAGITEGRENSSFYLKFVATSLFASLTITLLVLLLRSLTVMSQQQSTPTHPKKTTPSSSPLRISPFEAAPSVRKATANPSQRKSTGKLPKKPSTLQTSSTASSSSKSTSSPSSSSHQKPKTPSADARPGITDPTSVSPSNASTVFTLDQFLTALKTRATDPVCRS